MKKGTIFESISWTSVDLPSKPATIPLMIGSVGTGTPRATIIAGVHGDEGPWGALAIQQVLERKRTQLTGSLQIVFAANPLAVVADKRNSPLDDLDLNRIFPGKDDGSHSERIAAALMPIITDTNVLIDLHGGGSWCVNAFTFSFPGSEKLAALVDVPFVVPIDNREGQLSYYARQAGAKVIAIEMGGRSRDELRWRDRLSASLERILTVSEVLEPVTTDDFEQQAVTVTDLKVLRPSYGGVLIPEVREDSIGHCVPQGTLLGTVVDVGTMATKERLLAPYETTALLLLRPHVTVLEGGAMTYVVGRPGA
jgi:predicted deacylase